MRMPRFAAPAVNVRPMPDGGLVLESPVPLEPYAAHLGELLVAAAAAAPDRTFLAEREADGGWRRITYGEVLGAARALGQAFLGLGATPERPVAILSDNTIDHALRRARRDARRRAGRADLAGLQPPVARTSTSSAPSSTPSRPAVVYVDDPAAYGRALAALAGTARSSPAAGPAPATVDDLRRTTPGVGPRAGRRRHRARHRRQDPLHLGLDRRSRRAWSTRSACSAPTSRRSRSCWPFLARPAAGHRRLAAVEPHLRRQPQLQPGAAPRRHAVHRRRQAGARTLSRPPCANLREISPTLYFNVPRGFDMLLPRARARRRAARAASSASSTWSSTPPPRCRSRPGSGSSALAQRGARRPRRHGLGLGLDRDRAARDRGALPDRRAPASSACPRPGCELKLAPVGRQARAARARPQRHARLLAARRRPSSPRALDERRLPSASATPASSPTPRDPRAASSSTAASPRTSSSSTGTWVARRRAARRAASPPARRSSPDAVITGHDRDEVGAPALRAPAAPAADARRALPRARSPPTTPRTPRSSTRIARALVLAEPPSIDAGEITDKGYLNQRAVLDRRAAAGRARSTREPPDPDVIVLE